MKTLSRWLMWALIASSAAAAPVPSPPVSHAPSPAPSPAVAGTPVVSGDYRIGPGDVLDVTVFGNEDLSRTPVVQTNGTVSLPLLGEIPVVAMTVGEIRVKLTSLLRAYLVNPQVEVKIKEYQSQFVTVLGEVNSPGRKPLRGRTRLIDMLVDAGGFTPRASGEIVITRREGTFDGHERTLRMRVGSGTPSAQDQINLEILLKDGDIVLASPKYYVTVEGEVNRPGRYVLDGEVTVSGAISMAGGLTRFGSNKLKVRRIDPQTGRTGILKLDLKSVQNGKKQDLVLQPNDVVSVSRRIF